MLHIFLLVLLLAVNVSSAFAECGTADIAVLDTGIALSHPDFSGKVVLPKGTSDFGNLDQNPQDDMMAVVEPGGKPVFYGGHGTSVAGIALGLHNSSPAAVAQLSCPVKVMPFKIALSSCSYSQWEQMDCLSAQAALAALDAAIREPNIKVINMSFGIKEPVFAQQLIFRLQDAKARGKFVVISAGNDSEDLDSLLGLINSRLPVKLCRGKSPKCKRKVFQGLALGPALIREYPNLVLVASASRHGMDQYSNFGKQTVHLGTEGENIFSVDVAGISPTREYSGTSQSAPRVSRALALLAAQYPRDNYLNTLNRLKNLLRKDNQAVNTTTIWGGYLQ
ncbi:MAG: hypothetical protein EBQ92_13220 [Proteobacteria bacterium]|nr:hypothetical protein [Pseudomonadota bacterium]